MEEGERPPSAEQAEKDLRELSELLGARCVDATRVEHAVIDRCDTTVELKRRRADLSQAIREEGRLEARHRGTAATLAAAGRQAEGEAARGGAGGGQDRDRAAADAEAAAEELEAAREKRRRLEAVVQLLEQRVKVLRQSDLAEAGPVEEEDDRDGDGDVGAGAGASAAAAGALASADAAALLGAGPPPPASQGPSLRWGRLKGSTSSQRATPLVVDGEDGAADPDEASTTAPSQSQPEPTAASASSSSSSSAAAASAGAAAEARPGAVAPVPPPVLPLREKASSTLSAKEYLARFQARKAAAAAAAAAQQQQQQQQQPATKGGGARLPVASPSAAAAEGERGQRRGGPEGGSEDAAGAGKGEAEGKRTAVKVEGGTEEARVRVKDEGDCEGGVPGRPAAYQVDVGRLVPKATLEDPNRWRGLTAAQRESVKGDAVSPYENLLQAKPNAFVKRKWSEASGGGEPRKVRRGDDTNDKAFERRQNIFAQAPGASSAALAAKQRVDEAGVPQGAVKAELKEEGEEEGEEKGLKDEEEGEEGDASRSRDDVPIAEGLRSPRWLWEALYPYQHTCVRWLWDLHREKMGGILADEMGLGKTVQIAAYLGVLHHSGVLQRMRIQNGPSASLSTGGVLIVCPATLISQWRNELHVWYPPLRVCVMHQVGAEERRETIRVAEQEHGVLITSYETMRIAHEELVQSTWVVMILDEGQKIRNPNAGVTLAAKQFSTPHRIVLSGSPIQNNLRELWSLFDYICPGRLGTLPVFTEEFADTIESANLVGASEAKVAAAYECALALRELTQPCILRRTKAECMDVLKLPHKQEQVLFCHLTPEQYQVYIDFLQTEQVAKAMSTSKDERSTGAAFFSIGVLRKLCNHPDLLLASAGSDLLPEDMWNPERSGKMKVLSEIMKKWKREGHRALIFVQTVQMLEVLQRWMNGEGYTHLRIDGKTAVNRRLKMIQEFNGNPQYFAMLLTTRVGGVGLNIVGANRVVIYDPDWNPMTDVQARERTWRIGQRRDVTVYRLVLSGTIEEKIYQRQVYKHFLSQKILNDPRQRQFFKWNDLADLFDLPPMPPGFSPKDMLALKQKYRALFQKLSKATENYGENEVETTEVMKAISDLPTKEQNKAGKESKKEHNAILQTLFDSNGIKATFNHDKVEQPLLDRRMMREGATSIASRALAALQKSSRERASHHISEPTWTGQKGRAGAAVAMKREPIKREIKRELPSAVGVGSIRALTTRMGASPVHVMEGLKQLSSIRAAAKRRGETQSDEATRMGLLRRRQGGGGAPAEGLKTKVEPKDELPITSQGAEEDGDGAPRDDVEEELHESDRVVAEIILKAFLDPKLAGRGHCLSTGQVLQHLAGEIAPHHRDLFKSLLHQMCELEKPKTANQPGIWTLRSEFWPSAAAS